MSRSAHFADPFLEAILQTSSTQSDELATMLKNVEQSLTTNEKQVQENMTLIESRIDKVMKQMEQLR